MLVRLELLSNCSLPIWQILNIHEQKACSRSGFIQQRAKPPACSPACLGAPSLLPKHLQPPRMLWGKGSLENTPCSLLCLHTGLAAFLTGQGFIICL